MRLSAGDSLENTYRRRFNRFILVFRGILDKVEKAYNAHILLFILSL